MKKTLIFKIETNLNSTDIIIYIVNIYNIFYISETLENLELCEAFSLEKELSLFS